MSSISFAPIGAIPLYHIFQLPSIDGIYEIGYSLLFKITKNPKRLKSVWDFTVLFILRSRILLYKRIDHSSERAFAVRVSLSAIVTVIAVFYHYLDLIHIVAEMV